MLGAGAGGGDTSHLVEPARIRCTAVFPWACGAVLAAAAPPEQGRGCLALRPCAAPGGAMRRGRSRAAEGAGAPMHSIDGSGRAWAPFAMDAAALDATRAVASQNATNAQTQTAAAALRRHPLVRGLPSLLRVPASHACNSGAALSLPSHGPPHTLASSYAPFPPTRTAASQKRFQRCQCRRRPPTTQWHAS